MTTTRRIYVRNTENARKYGLGGHAGYVESTREGGTLRVCVYDLDGGLAGPFDLTEADVIDDTNPAPTARRERR